MRLGKPGNETRRATGSHIMRCPANKWCSLTIHSKQFHSSLKMVLRSTSPTTCVQRVANTSDGLMRSLDPDSDGLAEGLRESLRLAHLQREDLTPRDGCEGCVRAKCLGHPCRGPGGGGGGGHGEEGEGVWFRD